MAYSTLILFRRLTHFTTSHISDTDIGNLIAEADRAVVRLTTTEVWLEELTGNIDGSNMDFRTKHNPIADSTASGTVVAADVTVYYATFDSTTHWRELGSAQTVTSIQAETGIITMETAPTTATAEAGVFAIYRYDSLGKVDYDILAQAATYYLAYLVANKLRGKTPDYSTTAPDAPYLRRDLIGGDWLALCYETLGLQDKIFLVRPDGDGIPEIKPFHVVSGIKDV